MVMSFVSMHLVCFTFFYTGYKWPEIYSIQLIEGRIQYRYENATLRLKEARVDDGLWHHVEIKWMSGEVWINLDYGNYEDTLKVNEQVANHYIGTVSVGGVQPSDQATVIGFKGCIKVSWLLM